MCPCCRQSGSNAGDLFGIRMYSVRVERMLSSQTDSMNPRLAAALMLVALAGRRSRANCERRPRPARLVHDGFDAAVLGAGPVVGPRLARTVRAVAAQGEALGADAALDQVTLDRQRALLG